MDERDVIVDGLPRRTAHAVHALLVSRHQSWTPKPPTAAEVCVFDPEALSVRSTAAALREASRRGLAHCAGGYWLATNRAHEIERALETRVLSEQERADGA